MRVVPASLSLLDATFCVAISAFLLAEIFAAKAFAFVHTTV